MKKKLLLNWDTGMAFGEFFSVVILTFFILLFLQKKKSKGSFSALFAISGFFAMIIGWLIGSWISGQGYGISFMSPINTIFMSFYFGAYNALWFLLLFQLIGTIFGAVIFLLYKYALTGKFFHKQSTEKNISIKPNIIKSSIFQMLMVISISFIPLLDATSYDTGKVINVLIGSASLGLIIYASYDLNMSIYSPFLSFVVLLIRLKEKKYNLKHVINISIEASIQQSWLWIIILINHFVYLSKGGLF